MLTNVIAAAAVWLAVGAGPEADLKKLQGDWVLVGGESEGRKLSEEEMKAAGLVIKGDKYTVKFGDETHKGTLKLDPSKTPKTMDSTSAEGDTLLGIYELKGDLFKVCLTQSGRERPKDFTSGDFVHVWKRAKK